MAVENVVVCEKHKVLITGGTCTTNFLSIMLKFNKLIIIQLAPDFRKTLVKTYSLRKACLS